MSDHLQGSHEEKAMCVLCYVLSAASSVVCLFLLIRSILGWWASPERSSAMGRKQH